MSWIDYDQTVLESLLENIEKYAEFGSPFIINSYGEFANSRGYGKPGKAFTYFDYNQTLNVDVRAPDVENDEEHDILIDGRAWKDVDDWNPMRGLTGQYGYNGCVLHPSEQYSLGVVAEMLDRLDPGEFGVFCHTSVEVRCDDTCEEDCMGDHFPAGWVILQYTAGK